MRTAFLIEEGVTAFRIVVHVWQMRGHRDDFLLVLFEWSKNFVEQGVYLLEEAWKFRLQVSDGFRLPLIMWWCVEGERQVLGNGGSSHETARG